MKLPLWQNMPVHWVLLDRDGVINQDSPEYIRSVDQWQPIEGSIDAMARLYAAGCKIVVITNQSGIGRGYYDRRELFLMHQKMSALLVDQAAQVEGVFYCPHLPDESCDCRKPAAGMLLRALTCFSFPAEHAVLVGDSERDLLAAAAANVSAVRVGSNGDFATLADWVERLLEPVS